MCRLWGVSVRVRGKVVTLCAVPCHPVGSGSTALGKTLCSTASAQSPANWRELWRYVPRGWMETEARVLLQNYNLGYATLLSYSIAGFKRMVCCPLVFVIMSIKCNLYVNECIPKSFSAVDNTDAVHHLVSLCSLEHSARLRTQQLQNGLQNFSNSD